MDGERDIPEIYRSNRDGRSKLERRVKEMDYEIGESFTGEEMVPIQ